LDDPRRDRQPSRPQPTCGSEYSCRARCEKTARRDLCEGGWVTGRPTAMATGKNMDSSELAKELAGRYLPTITNQFGHLFVRDAQGKITASGTATFVDVDGYKLIVTADHVASQLAADSDAMSLFILPPADVLIASPNTAFSGPVFRVDPQDRIILSQGASLDVAAFWAPRAVASVPHLRWIEASAQLRAVEFLRSEYQREAIPFLLFITGFPNFSRVTDPARRIQLSSNFQCWGYLRQIIDNGSDKNQAAIAP